MENISNQVVKIKLADGSMLDIITVRGGMEFIQNSNRDVLTFEFKADDINIDELVKTFQDENKTKQISLLDESANVINVLDNYVIYLSVGNKIQEIPTESGEFSGVEQKEINFAKVAQITYTEFLLRQVLSQR